MDASRSTHQTTVPQSFFGLELLRLGACALIVLYHAQSMSRVIPLQNGHILGAPAPGWFAAVDFFFVMSAFLVVVLGSGLYGRADGARTFAVRRAIRIVPLYWAFTVVFALLYLFADGGSKGADFVSVERFIKSLLFIPMEGDPIIPLGWTMNFEVFFLLLSGLTFLLPSSVGPVSLIGSIAGMVALGQVFDITSMPLGFWTDPIMLDFAWGVTAAIIYLKGVRLSWQISAGLILAGILLIMSADEYFGPRALLRPFTWGGGAGLIIAATVLCRTYFPRNFLSKIVTRLNMSVYSVYLSHVIVLKALWMIYIPSGLATIHGPIPFMITASILAFAAGYAFYIICERPLSTRLKHSFL